MTQLNATISTLLVRYAKGEASPEEKRQLDAWASLSAENRSWLEQIADPAWQQKQSDLLHAIDLDERSQTFWSMVNTPKTPQSGQPGKLQYIPALKKLGQVAAIIILVSALVIYWFLSSNNTIDQTARLFNNTNKTSPPIDSTPQPVAPTLAYYESSCPPVSGTIKPIDKKMKARCRVNVSIKPQEEDTIKTFYSNRTLAPNTMRYSYAANGGAASGLELNNKLVPAKGYAMIDLPDGSRVWLNAMTQFLHPTVFTGNKRQVKVLGEAYFDVMPNDSMPFRVVVNGVELETNGGRFNINAYGNETAKKITVLYGTVRVATGPHADTVYENQAARVEKYITVEQNADTLRATAWKDRQFLYKQDSLPVVIKELARRYDLIPEGNINPHTLISYSGAWTETAEETLAAIQRENKNFHYTIAGRKLTLE